MAVRLKRDSWQTSDGACFPRRGEPLSFPRSCSRRSSPEPSPPPSPTPPHPTAPRPTPPHLGRVAGRRRGEQQQQGARQDLGGHCLPVRPGSKQPRALPWCARLRAALPPRSSPPPPRPSPSHARPYATTTSRHADFDTALGDAIVATTGGSAALTMENEKAKQLVAVVAATPQPQPQPHVIQPSPSPPSSPPASPSMAHLSLDGSLMEPFGLLCSPFSPPLPAAETSGIAGASPGVVTDDDTVRSVAGGAEGGSECAEMAEEGDGDGEGEGEKEMINMDWSIDTLAHLNRCTDFGLGEAQVIHATPQRPTAPVEAEAHPVSDGATTAAVNGPGHQLAGRNPRPDPPVPFSPSFESRHHDSHHDPKQQWLHDAEDTERGAEAEMEAQQQVDQYWSNPLAMAKLATPLRNQRAMPAALPLIAPSPIPASPLDEALRTPARTSGRLPVPNPRPRSSSYGRAPVSSAKSGPQMRYPRLT